MVKSEIKPMVKSWIESMIKSMVKSWMKSIIKSMIKFASSLDSWLYSR
jgi:hypothetical protein